MLSSHPFTKSNGSALNDCQQKEKAEGKMAAAAAEYVGGMDTEAYARHGIMQKNQQLDEIDKKFYQEIYQQEFKPRLEEIRLMRLEGRDTEARHKLKTLKRNLHLAKASFGTLYVIHESKGQIAAAACELNSAPPERTALRFQMHENNHPKLQAAAKAELAKDIADAEYVGGMGTGAYAWHRIIQKNQQLDEIDKKFYQEIYQQEFKPRLEEIRLMRLEGRDTEARYKLKTLKRNLDLAKGTFGTRYVAYESSGSSDSDTASEKAEIATSHQKNAIKARDTLYHWKKLEAFLVRVRGQIHSCANRLWLTQEWI